MSISLNSMDKGQLVSWLNKVRWLHRAHSLPLCMSTWVAHLYLHATRSAGTRERKRKKRKQEKKKREFIIEKVCKREVQVAESFFLSVMFTVFDNNSCHPSESLLTLKILYFSPQTATIYCKQLAFLKDSENIIFRKIWRNNQVFRRIERNKVGGK